MSLPDSRNETYVAGITNVKSATMNQAQDELTKIWRASRGADFLFFDDFVGDTVDRSKWVTPANVGLGADPIVPSAGAVSFSPTGVTGANLTTQWLQLGTKDFRLLVLARLNNYAGWAANDEFRVRLEGTSSFGQIQLNVVKGTNGDRWQAGVVIAGTVFDTGVAAESTTYHALEIRRAGSTITTLIDGVLTNTFAGVPDLQAAALDISQFSTTAAGVVKTYADKAALWITSFPTSGGSAVAGVSAGHIEQGVATFTGAEDFLDIVFGSDFADTTYYFTVATLVTDGDSNVDVNFIPTPSVAQTHGLRLQPTVRFSGRVSWSVYK